MVVASGQMPYAFDGPLPIRALPGAWPGVDTPNIALSGLTIEQAMFVYNAELRKWNFDSLSSLTYQLYTHPDISSSGFEPKANGDTLEGLVGGLHSIESVDNIEQLRTQLQTFLFTFYATDSNYGEGDFMQSWLETAFPESPSGSLRIIQPFFPLLISSFVGRTFLRPPAEHISGGDYVDNDIHWLGGSGVLFDIDCGEVVFNPFPFPRNSFFFAPSRDNSRFAFGPVYPVVQTTLGVTPSVIASRYESDIDAGTFRAETNFAALGSGKVQIDGYCLIDGTTMELVKGNDRNISSSVGFTDDYTLHVQGLREVRNGAGSNDPSARCYRTAGVKASGLYRFLTHNQKVNVPNTAIPSGFVSLWPQGHITQSDHFVDNSVFVESNFIDGQQTTDRSTADGSAFELDPGDAFGIHVFDDCIWITGPNGSGTSSPPGSVLSRGLFPLSPFTGRLVWYRPAELTIATTGPTTSPDGFRPLPPQPGAFGHHLGLMDIGTEFVRVSKIFRANFDAMGGGDADDEFDRTVYFQRYGKTTLTRNSETAANFMITGSEASNAGYSAIHGAVYDGTSIYVFNEFGELDRFDSSFTHTGTLEGPIARRRHWDGTQLLYTLGGNVTTGDPLLSVPGGTGSGIGVWSVSSEPADPAVNLGAYSHDSAKPTRLERFIQTNPASTRIHTIFEVTGATHVRNGVWMIFQEGTDLWLFRIIEEASEWVAVEGMKLDDVAATIPGGGVPTNFPWEGVLHDID